MEIDAVKRCYANARRMYQNCVIDAVKYLEWKHKIDDDFEKAMKGYDNERRTNRR